MATYETTIERANDEEAGGGGTYTPEFTAIVDELLTGTVNGTNAVFTTANDFVSIRVFKNGVAMHLGDDYTITGTNQITFVTAPATGTKLVADYYTDVLGSGVAWGSVTDADTVDTYHANPTPTANTIPVLDGNALLPNTAIGGVPTTWTPTYTASGSMTYTSVTTSIARYTQIGKFIFFTLNCTGTTGGTTSTSIYFTLPVTAKSGGGLQGFNVSLSPAGGTTVAGWASRNTTTQAIVRRYDSGNITLGAGTAFNISGFYEVD